MACFLDKGLLCLKWLPSLQQLRFSRRVNLKRPRAPHYERAKVLRLVDPIFPKPVETLLPSLRCKKKLEVLESNYREDNPFEYVLAKEIQNWMNHSKMVTIFHVNPISDHDERQAVIAFKRHQMHLKQYSKYCVQIAVENTPYANIMPLFVGHQMFVFSEQIQLAMLLKISKKIPQLVLMAGVVEGRLLSLSQLLTYSKLPDKTTCRAQLVSVMNSVASHVVDNLNRHQSTLVSQLDQYCALQKPASSVSVDTANQECENENSNGEMPK